MAVERLLDARIHIRGAEYFPEDKLLSFDQTRAFIQSAHDRGKSVILVEGTWDLTHAGHVQHIREAKKYSDLVVLRLASAEYAGNYKGLGRPIEIFRDMVVSEFEDVDAVFVDTTVIHPNDIAENAHILAQLKPDKFALELEDDKFIQKIQSTEYANRHLGCDIQPVILMLPNINSTTSIISKIKSQVELIRK